MSDEITIGKPEPKRHTVAAGTRVTFTCTVEPSEGLALQWKKGRPSDETENFVVMAGETRASLSVEAEEDQDYVLSARRSAGGEATIGERAELRVAASPSPNEPWEYDPIFTARTFARLALVWLAPIAALVAAAAVAMQAPPEAAIPALVALQLVAIATVLSLAAAYVALMEVRGMSRTATIVEVTPEAARAKNGRDLAAASGGTVRVLIGAVPRIIETFGGLRVSAALMILTGVTLLAAAALGWRALPGPAEAPEPTEAAPSVVTTTVATTGTLTAAPPVTVTTTTAPTLAAPDPATTEGPAAGETRDPEAPPATDTPAAGAP